MLKIESKEAIIQFETKGAQMTSFKKKGFEFEYLWQPQEPFWQGRNPILFPLVGSTYDKKLHIDGKEYAIGNHGFARNSEFEVVAQNEDSITFRLKDNVDTLSMYPYSFTMDVTYTLQGLEVKISYCITNLSETKMPFTFGLHPAFSCPFSEQETLEDCYLEFSNEEDQICQFSQMKYTQVKQIPLNEALFEKAKTILFENCRSSYVDLTDGKQGVRVFFPGYRWIAFWKQKDAQFVCIEPWHGHGDVDDSIMEFKDRQGMIQLNPQQSYTTEYKIAVF